MQRRIVVALVVFSLALAILTLRYVPARHAHVELGDPVEGVIATGLYIPEPDGAALVRWSQANVGLSIPLADRRGAQHVTLALRVEEAEPQTIALQIDQAAVTAIATDLPRAFHVFAPPTAERALELALEIPDSAITPQSPRGAGIDRLSVIGREGWPPLPDLGAILALALIPVLLMALAIELPFDWSVVPGALLLAVYGVLPSSDLPRLLLIGPLVALLVAGIALLPFARQHPTLALLALAGAGLRGYGLGWGGGFAFHPVEQALAQGSAVKPIQQIAIWASHWAVELSGNDSWATAWGRVLLGRVWSVLFGTALIVVVYLIGRRLLRPRWALLATAYAAFVPVLIQQSHLATSIVFEALLVALLMLSSTQVALTGRLRYSIGCGMWSGVALAFCPHGGTLLIAPIAAHLLMRPRRGPAFATAATSAALCLVVLHWLTDTTGATVAASTALAQNDTTAVESLKQLPMIDSAVHALFNVLLWSLGPLLMQLSVVGWGFGMIQSLQERRNLAWLPLLWSMGAYFVAALLGPNLAHSLMLLVPLLCLTAAFLLQSFGLRLNHPLGQRTVRLLAGTGLCLALMTSVGLLHVYRSPDPRIAASRWLLANVASGKQVLHDASVPEQLPLGMQHIHNIRSLPASAADDDQRRAEYVAALTQADYVVLAVDRGDPELNRQIQRDPVAACYYRALFEGRLGFVPRAGFDAQPQITAWTMDDSWVDPALRRYDHPYLRIYERVVTPTPEAIDLMLHCTGT